MAHVLIRYVSFSRTLRTARTHPIAHLSFREPRVLPGSEAGGLASMGAGPGKLEGGETGCGAKSPETEELYPPGDPTLLRR